MLMFEVARHYGAALHCFRHSGASQPSATQMVSRAILSPRNSWMLAPKCTGPPASVGFEIGEIRGGGDVRRPAIR